MTRQEQTHSDNYMNHVWLTKYYKDDASKQAMLGNGDA